MKVLLDLSESRNVIATTAIGSNYYDDWIRWAYPLWEAYCKRNGLGLVVFDKHLVPGAAGSEKKPYWQKLLIGASLSTEMPDVENVCFVDTDILANYVAPNIFDAYEPHSIGIVSQKSGLPYPLDSVLRRIAFHRHYCLDENYPLDSYLFASVAQVFEKHDLPRQNDFACTGLFVFNVKNHAELMRGWFEKYDCDTRTLDGGTEEVHLNYEIQNWGKVTWLDYRYQALWMYEMAWKYPFLYHRGRGQTDLVRACIEASLATNYFLHFAGSWEGDMWKTDGILDSTDSRFRLEKFCEYESRVLTGEPQGKITPGIGATKGVDDQL